MTILRKHLKMKKTEKFQIISKICKVMEVEIKGDKNMFEQLAEKIKELSVKEFKCATEKVRKFIEKYQLKLHIGMNVLKK